MHKRQYTGDKDITILRPPVRIKKNDYFLCDFKYSPKLQAYEYWVFPIVAGKSGPEVNARIEITQTTYYKLVNHSTEC